jgi:hypothetical protein
MSPGLFQKTSAANLNLKPAPWGRFRSFLRPGKPGGKRWPRRLGNVGGRARLSVAPHGRVEDDWQEPTPQAAASRDIDKPDDFRLESLVREWLLELRMMGRRPTHDRVVPAKDGLLRAFASWADREGYPVNPALLRVPAPKVAQKEVETYSTEQIERIFAATSPRVADNGDQGPPRDRYAAVRAVRPDRRGFRKRRREGISQGEARKGGKGPAGPSHQPTETRGGALPEPLAQRVPRPAGFLLLGEQRLAGDQPLVSRCDLQEIHGDLLVTDVNVTCGQIDRVPHI